MKVRMLGAFGLAAVLAAPAAVRGGEGADDAAARVEAALREVAGGEPYWHRADGLAGLGKGAIGSLAKILADPARPPRERQIAAEALGRTRLPEALAPLREAAKLQTLPDEVRKALEESEYLLGDPEAVDARLAVLATKHRDLPVAAGGAQDRVASALAATGRFRLAARVMGERVKAEREARPERARSLAYNWACWASLGGDRESALGAACMALESDRTDLDWMAKDPDLALLREDEAFRKALEEARGRRAPREDRNAALKILPGWAEYQELRDGYWNRAFEAYIQANNAYWDGCQEWLKAGGRTAGPEAEAEWKKAKGPEPKNPSPEWIPKFRALLEKFRGTPLGAAARENLLTIFGNEEKAKEYVDLYLEGLGDTPRPDSPPEGAGQALYFAEKAGRKDEVRARLAKLVEESPENPRVAGIRLAFAAELREAGKKDEARAAYARISKLHAGTQEAQEAEDAIYGMDRLADGMEAPDFAADDIRGKPVSLKVLRGKVVLLDFWATWCGPCLGELPAVKAIQEEFRGRDFALVGISLDEDGWALAELMEKEGMGWTQVCDLRGFEGAVPRLYRVRGIPHTVLLDREGRIVRTGLRGDDLRAAIRELLGTAK